MLYDRYYYSKLNKREKKAYNAIYGAMQNHEPTATVFGLMEVDLYKIITAIKRDNPHLFYVDFSYGRYSKLFSQTIELRYIYDKDETAVLTEKVKKVCNKILSSISGQTDYEKELSLHDILVKNIVYDNVARENLIRYRFRSNTILGPLFYKTAVCEGIAKTFKFLLNALDIKCIIAYGDANSETENNLGTDIIHAWNIVKLDGQPYHVDLTWDINLSDKNMICHSYFNLSDDDISVDHETSPDMPQCASNKESYYYKNGLIVESKSDLHGIIYKCIQNGINKVEFKLCKNVFENETEIGYFVQNSIKVDTYYSKSFSIGYTPNPQQNVYCFLWTFK